MARRGCWLARAGGDGTEENNLIGLYTSRTKARRAVLDFWGLKRGKWDEENPDHLDIHWIVEQAEDGNAFGYVVWWPIN